MRNAAARPQLQRELSQILSENESYRIDHYLGKELVMNVLVLRFANICFEVHGARAVKRRSARRDAPRSRFSHPLFWKQKAIWNRQHIANVQICCDEEIGTEGRGGYFDQYGACVATRERAIETVFHLRGRIAVSTQASLAT